MDANNQHLDLSLFRPIDRIGQGGFGEVFKVKHIKSKEIYAAKVSFRVLSSKDELNLKREVNILAGLKHPCILKYIGYSPINFYKENKPVIITEYLKNKSLRDILELESNSRALDGWNITSKIICIYCIACAMSFLHRQKIIHRDLKPENILMDENYRPKISDFGLSKILHQNPESITTQSEATLKGTYRYIAPETWRSNSYGPASDVYAFSIIVFEIMNLTIPFENVPNIEIGKKVLDGERPHLYDDVHEPYKELIEQCWSDDPSQRPTFEQIVEDMKTNPDYINIPGLDKDEFNECVENIDKKDIIYDPVKIDLYENTSKNQTSPSAFRKLFPKPVNFFKKDSFSALDKSCQIMVNQAQNDSYMQLSIGINLIEGSNNFGQNIQLGVNYLKESIENGCIDAAIYLCNLLIKGEIIQRNLNEAKKYLLKFFDYNNPQIQYLYGKVAKMQNKYQEARDNFMKSAQSGNLDSKYEYGIMLYFGEGGDRDVNNAIKFFNESRNNENSLKFLEIHNKMYSDGFNNLPIETQKFIISKAINCGMNSDLLINFNEVKMLYNNKKSLIKDHFLLILLKFTRVIIELEYPHGIFNDIYKTFKNNTINEVYKIGLHVIIPSKLVKPVIQINDDSFKNCKSLIKITIPSSLKTIGKKAFEGCSSLIQITMPDISVESIDENAFKNCSSITQITIPSSLKKIGEGAFASCSSLVQIKMPDKSVEIIDECAFDGCISITQITIPSSVKKIGKRAFEGCSSLSQIMIPDKSVELIDEYAFNGCSSITQITIPSSVKIIGVAAFAGCSSLIRIKMLGESVEQIGANAFDGCSSITRITIPSSTEKIGDYCFRNCVSLIKVTLPKSLSRIEMHTFWNCKSLTKVKAEQRITQQFLDHGNKLCEYLENTSNQVEACRWFLIAANNKYVAGMVKYAMFVEKGEFVPINLKAACYYYKKAADSGNEAGLLSYIKMIVEGIEENITDAEACYYYLMAANIGKTIGMVQLGIMLENGRGIHMNQKEACRYFKMAADMNDKNALYHYGRMLENGIGITKNISEAVYYYKMAKDKRHVEASKSYERLMLQLNDI